MAKPLKPLSATQAAQLIQQNVACGHSEPSALRGVGLEGKRVGGVNLPPERSFAQFSRGLPYFSVDAEQLLQIHETSKTHLEGRAWLLPSSAQGTRGGAGNGTWVKGLTLMSYFRPLRFLLNFSALIQKNVFSKLLASRPSTGWKWKVPPLTSAFRW